MTMIAACPACSTGNRVGDGDPRAAKCGRCGAKLFTGSPVDVDDATLAAHLKLSSMPVLVDIWAPFPALILFYEGNEIARQAGLMTTDQLGVWLSRALASVSTMETQT